MNVLVAGIPRCGTNLIYYTIKAYAELPVSKTFSFHASPWKQFGHDGHFKGESSFDFNEPTDNMKVIFIHGDIIKAVISTMRRMKETRWLKVHTINCGIRTNLDDPIPELNPIISDCFNYEKMFDAWFTTKDYPVLFVRYEQLYNNLHEVCNFLNKEFQFPDKTERRTTYRDVPHKQVFQIGNTYKSLRDKLQQLPDVVVHNKELL